MDSSDTEEKKPVVATKKKKSKTDEKVPQKRKRSSSSPNLKLFLNKSISSVTGKQAVVGCATSLTRVIELTAKALDVYEKKMEEKDKSGFIDFPYNVTQEWVFIPDIPPREMKKEEASGKKDLKLYMNKSLVSVSGKQPTIACAKDLNGVIKLVTETLKEYKIEMSEKDKKGFFCFPEKLDKEWVFIPDISSS